MAQRTDTKSLLALGQEAGLSGPDLRAFVKEQQEADREERRLQQEAQREERRLQQEAEREERRIQREEAREKNEQGAAELKLRLEHEREMEMIRRGTSPQASPASALQERAPSRRSRKMDTPILAGPATVNLVAFDDWARRWNDFVKLTCVREEVPDLAGRQAVFRSALDPEWSVLWSTGRLEVNDETDDLDDILTKIRQYIRRGHNPLLDRRAFHLRDQEEGESVDSYLSALSRLHDACSYEDDNFVCTSCFTSCNFGGRLKNTRLRDRLICGLSNQEMQQRVLTEDFHESLSLDKVVAICKAFESSRSTGSFLADRQSNLSVVSHRSLKRQLERRNTGNTPGATNHDKSQCGFCGSSPHPRSRCPAHNARCRNCNKLGHFESVCRQPKTAKARGQTSTSVAIAETRPAQTSAPADQADEGRLGHVFLHLTTPSATNLVQTKVKHDGAALGLVSWLPDTGADVDALTEKDYKSLAGGQHPTLEPSGISVRAANGTALGLRGTFVAWLDLNGRSCRSTVHVFSDLSYSLLSRATCIKLGLLEEGWPRSRLTLRARALSTDSSALAKTVPNIPTPTDTSESEEHIYRDYAEVFQDQPFRAMAGQPMHIELEGNAVPCRRLKARSIPLRWRDAVQAQITAMVRDGIIEKVPVGEPYTWCHPMVVVPKRGSNEPRITVDLTGLNKYVKRPAYPTHVPREVVASIPRGMKFFTTLDSRHGYWQVALDEESSRLTTFMTPWGAYRFRRNAMGLISAGDEHNRRGDEALVGLSNVVKVVEDVLIFDADFDTHCKRVRSVLERCRTNGITLNKTKFVFAQPVVEYCGFRVSSDGYTASDHLVDALQKFPTPISKSDVRSFCGLAQQFEAFTPRLTELLAPLHSLLPLNTAFVWEDPHQKAFEGVLKELTNPRLLASYDGKSPMRLETDASQSKGLGMALWQQQHDGQWRLLQCGSRRVTPAESRYSATEIELLAVTWATRKAHLFLAGSDFELIVDHRPLIPILNSKTLDELSSPRIVRLKEKLSPYRLVASWRPGTSHTVVDCLSRHPVNEPEPEDLDEEAGAEHSCSVMRAMAISDSESGNEIIADRCLARVKSVGGKDAEYVALTNAIRQGFPDRKDLLDLAVRPYWDHRHDLSLEDGVVLLGCRTVIPKSMRKEVLDCLHASHQGQQRTLSRARQVVFWPNISNDIRNVVRGCRLCAAHLPSQQREPLIQDPRPTRPFECDAADLFHLAGKTFLVITDKFSGWPIFIPCGRQAPASTVIRHMKDTFMDKGIPVRLTTDGGPQFTSLEFRKFCEEWGIAHDPSSPHYPQANGAAEAAVKAIKTLLSKTSPNGEVNDAFRKGLIELRNTPLAHGLSPAQLVFGRPMRSNVPAHHRSFRQEWQRESAEADKAAARLREKAKECYDRHSKQLPVLPVGAVVLVQHPRTKRWSTIAEVIDQDPRGRSYVVRTESGNVFWRNRRFLRLFKS